MKKDAPNLTTVLIALVVILVFSVMGSSAGHCTSDADLRKLHPDLRKIASQAAPNIQKESLKAVGTQEPILIQVLAWVESDEKGKATLLDLTTYFAEGKVLARPPLKIGEKWLRVYFGKAAPVALLKIASIAQVSQLLPVVSERNAWPDDYPADAPRKDLKKVSEDWARLRETAPARSAGSLSWQEASEKPLSMKLKSWFETGLDGPHKAKAAWDRGYMGEGVTVAVLDDGVDFAHPDLLGTHKIYSSTAAPQYDGWPVAFSPYSMLLYAYDEVLGTHYIQRGSDGIDYVDTGTTPSLTGWDGSGTSTFEFTPLISYNTPGTQHTYTINDSMTLSGVIHVGTHTDNDLRDYVWGEKVAILVCDPNSSGVYDTVYVDLDNDYDFTDEKPLTRAVVANPATHNDPVCFRDMNGDGLPDLSGGALYFIADGANVIPGSNWLWGATCGGTPFMCPGNGDLVALTGPSWGSGYSHGTQCASNIVGQGVTQSSAAPNNYMLPSFTDLPGKPSAAVIGMAPNAKVTSFSDIYYNHDSSTLDAYLFAAVGYDGIDQTGWNMIFGPGFTDTDPIQLTSNSYGASQRDNDGWEIKGQMVSLIQRYFAPHLQFLFSTGNGAPAYGTVAPPSPDTGISVGATTQFGSTGWDSIYQTTQIMFNDIQPFSNKGPGARGTAGVDVAAGGAYAAGAEALNYYTSSFWGVLDGNLSWDTWGGTSRSTPVASGILALIYQAYKANYGTWPTFQAAKDILMSSSTDLFYDTFSQGAGSVNADRGTAVAGGHYGVFVENSTWEPGAYRGNNFPGFAHVVYPGDTFSKTFTVRNTSATPVTVGITDAELIKTGSVTRQLVVTPEMVAAESAYGAANRDNFYKAFNYFLPLTATGAKIAQNPDWDRITIPADTDLMIVRQRFDYSQYDANGDYAWDNRFYLMVYNWKDQNNDGNVWEDKDGNGVVNFINATDITQIDGGTELVWTDLRTELDQGEYGRFAYHRPSGNRNELWVRKPMERMIDGLFIGLRHHPSSTFNGTTTIVFQIEFYKKANVGWLNTDVNSLLIPGNGSATFQATAAVPADIPPGIYQAALEISDPGTAPYSPHTTILPVTMSVAANFSEGLQLGGLTSYNYDLNRPYNNGAVRGLFDWSWREESGDWRFFFVDVDLTPPLPSKILIRDQWTGLTPNTDIDTVLLGPTANSGAFFGGYWYATPDPPYFGPYTLDTVAKSTVDRSGRATWRFHTPSGGNVDLVAGPMQQGLHEVLQHNVLVQGDIFDVIFTKSLGSADVYPPAFTINRCGDAGEVGTLTFQSGVDLEGLVGDAYGLTFPEIFSNEPLGYNGTGVLDWVHTFTVSHGAKINIVTSSGLSDIDLFLYYCPTGDCYAQAVQRASSASASSSEGITYAMPEDGTWAVGIDNYSGPAGAFNMTLTVMQGNGLTVSGFPAGAVPAGTPVALDVVFSSPMLVGEAYQGLVLLGPPSSPGLIEVPVSITRQASIPGDADNDCQYTQGDVDAIINGILEIETPPGDGDRNGDGSVNILDAIAVMNNMTAPPLLPLGDEEGLSAGSGAGAKGASLTVPVSFTNTHNKAVGMQFDLVFNQAIANINSVNLAGIFPPSLVFNWHSVQPGRIRVTMLMSDYSAIPQGQLLNLAADLLNNGLSPVNFQNVVMSDSHANQLQNITLSNGQIQVGEAAPVPTLSEWSSLIMICLLLIAGAAILRRRRFDYQKKIFG